MNLITRLVDADNEAVFGNKTAVLSRLKKSGANIPEGFGIPVDYFYSFCEANGLSAEEIDLIDDEKCQSYNKLLDILDNGKWEKELYEKMKKPFEYIHYPICVRSSGLNEDSKISSMAGFYMSCVNVRNYAEYLAAIRTCWKSAFHPHIINYNKKIGLKCKPIPLLVQHLQESIVSGVAFYTKEKIIVSASYGLCMGVVTGNNICDQYVWESTVNKWEKTIAYKDKCFIPLSDKDFLHYADCEDITIKWKNGLYQGFHQIDANEQFSIGLYAIRLTPPEDIRILPILTDKELEELKKSFRIYAERLGYNSADFEWCQDSENSFHLLQARPFLVNKFGRTITSWKSKLDNQYIGVPISQGVHTGKLIMYRSKEDLNLICEGDVVFMEIIPDDFMGIISKVGGIILRSDVLLSHCAIIARELGIPCVGGILPQNFTNGNIYTVDGNEGIVTLKND